MDERIQALMTTVRAEAAAGRVSVKALAAAAGVSYPAMRRYLNGQRPMDLSQLYRVIDVLGIDPKVLLERASERASEPASQPASQPAPSQRNRRRRGSEGQLELSARLRDVVTHSETTSSGVPSPDELKELARRAAEEIKNSKRVKRGRRSGD